MPSLFWGGSDEFPADTHPSICGGGSYTAAPADQDSEVKGVKRFHGLKSSAMRKAVEEQGLGADTLTPLTEYGEHATRAIHFDRFCKTQETYASQMAEPFEVVTLEGIMSGKAGDWLAVGAQGEMYPIDAEVFSVTYEPAD